MEVEDLDLEVTEAELMEAVEEESLMAVLVELMEAVEAYIVLEDHGIY